MKITVERKALIAAIKDERKRQAEAITKSQTKYEKEMARVRKVAIANLQSYLSDLETGGEVVTSNYDLGQRLCRGLNEPKEPREVDPKLDKLLTRLELASDEFLLISDQEDYFKYI